jgi:hypothetical protein
MELAIPMDDVVVRLQKRWLASFAEAVEEWSTYVSALSRWEDDHLLDAPTAELLSEHKTAVERLLTFGRFLSLVTANESFPQNHVSEMVVATQVVLQDKLRMWHGPRMGKTESDRILAACFPDEP